MLLSGGGADDSEAGGGGSSVPSTPHTRSGNRVDEVDFLVLKEEDEGLLDSRKPMEHCREADQRRALHKSGLFQLTVDSRFIVYE